MNSRLVLPPFGSLGNKTAIFASFDETAAGSADRIQRGLYRITP